VDIDGDGTAEIAADKDGLFSTKDRFYWWWEDDQFHQGDRPNTGYYNRWCDWNQDGIFDYVTVLDPPLPWEQWPPDTARISLYIQTDPFEYEHHDLGIVFETYFDLEVADFNSDGRVDVLVSGRRYGGWGRFIYLLLNEEQGVNTVQILTEIDSMEYRDLYVADLNGDGRQDIVSLVHRPGEELFQHDDYIVWYENVDENAVDALPDNAPVRFALHAAYPNPFNSTTTIRYDLPETSQTRVEVFNLLGKSVALLVDNEIAAGQHSIAFEAAHLPSGIYLLKLHAGDFTDEQKLVLLR